MKIGRWEYPPGIATKPLPERPTGRPTARVAINGSEADVLADRPALRQEAAALRAEIEDLRRRLADYESRYGPSRYQQRLELGQLVWDGATREATIDCAPIPLTPTEFNLLGLLLSNAGRCVSLEAFRGVLWPTWSYPAGRHVLRVNMSRLRAKLRPHGLDGALVNRSGVGYLFDPERAPR